MSIARATERRRAPAAPRLRLVDESTSRSRSAGAPPSRHGGRSRPAGPHPAVVAVAMFVALVATAVGFKAQQVSGQSHLDSVRDQLGQARELQLELRASVAEIESPEKVLDAARELGMVDPAPVVAVPAPPPPAEVDPG